MLYIVRGFALFNWGRFGNYTRDGRFAGGVHEGEACQLPTRRGRDRKSVV